MIKGTTYEKLRQSQRRDYIVVGTGSVTEYLLTSRLAAKSRHVLLVESGDADTGRWLRTARRAGR